MWNGRWGRELDALSGMYCEVFGEEPDCDPDMDFDNVSYNAFRDGIRKSIVLRVPLKEVLGH